MKSNICWSTKYYVLVGDFEICAEYHNDRRPTQWEVYVKTKDSTELQPLIDAFNASKIKFYISDTRLVLDIKSQVEDETFIGGYLPTIYEELLEQIERVVHEILRDKEN